jgi:calmodulin
MLFEQFDKDNDGRITKTELNFVMQNLFPDEVITDGDIEDMLQAADLNKSGCIDFDEFANMFVLHSTNVAVVQKAGITDPLDTNSGNISNQKHTKKNTSNTNLKSSESLTKSSRPGFKILSRSSSKEKSRSRNTSGQRSETDSPHSYRKVVQIFTASQMMDLKAAFHMFDKNGDQKISGDELYEVMKYLGISATETEVTAMIQVVDKNKNGCVDYEEFIHMMTKTQLKPLSQEDELRKTFNIFDINGDGFICHEEIKKTMVHLGENISDKEVQEMIKAADRNGDGQIDINEFSGLLNGTNVFRS